MSQSTTAPVTGNFSDIAYLFFDDVEDEQATDLANEQESNQDFWVQPEQT